MGLGSWFGFGFGFNHGFMGLVYRFMGFLEA